MGEEEEGERERGGEGSVQWSVLYLVRNDAVETTCDDQTIQIINIYVRSQSEGEQHTAKLVEERGDDESPLSHCEQSSCWGGLYSFAQSPC